MKRSLVLAALIVAMLCFSKESLCSPRVFIAVHMEPAKGGNTLDVQYEVLLRMMAVSNQHGATLNLMFSPPWAEFMTSGKDQFTNLARWKAAHAVGMHHHATNCPTWDGYSDYGSFQIKSIRGNGMLPPIRYIGNLADMMQRLRPFWGNPSFGCFNDEADKNELPNTVHYLTCTGYLNHGVPGRTASQNSDPFNGVNEHVLAKYINGYLRFSVSHFCAPNLETEAKVERIIDGMRDDAVYGVIVHPTDQQAEVLHKLLDFIYERGIATLTIQEVIESSGLPVVLVE